ncbi:mechanosensitive ion channel family protein [Halieaceae bacterium IMCC14734]|uniref:Mechanosensitive ion channel family protein n=1 Tax=Candidatus Litorirhabdus singularis TaxID=2518993 RepID=A0ABT3TDL6_9GAMM|nr:mechanosensitive ion channel family protein [Candidatus Litorirhabdus singularis]MCX2980376.1 mechanosensitive ion channel family protein [Candidatus Litorirhabdus singularis]
MLKQLADIHPLLPDAGLLLLLIAVALIAYWVAANIFVAALHVVAKKTAHTWDDSFIVFGVGRRLAQMVPAFIIYIGVNWMPILEPGVTEVLLNVTSAYMILVVCFTLTAILSALNHIYESSPVSRQRPMKGFVQLLQIVIIIVSMLLFISALMDRSPVILLSGFGAMTAVLLLVFKDTILSLVASVQLSAQDMVRVGDWIEVPQFGADGDVVDVELHTVKVQNFDKTITTVPTHRLISDSFKNWRGMSESGGRRIKRSLSLDATSVHFLSADEAASCRRFELLTDYLDGKTNELDRYNDARNQTVDQRRLTNIGTFRAYIYCYLKSHEQVRKDMTLLVRQLPSGPEGIPIELYCFTSTTAWSEYEGIQADIFDHLLAIIPEFGLRIYQHPAGSDLARLYPG